LIYRLFYFCQMSIFTSFYRILPLLLTEY
jgi:hypothetical protein